MASGRRRSSRKRKRDDEDDEDYEEIDERKLIRSMWKKNRPKRPVLFS